MKKEECNTERYKKSAITRQKMKSSHGPIKEVTKVYTIIGLERGIQKGIKNMRKVRKHSYKILLLVLSFILLSMIGCSKNSDKEFINPLLLQINHQNNIFVWQ